jgi:phage terminase large subunit-like protein
LSTPDEEALHDAMQVFFTAAELTATRELEVNNGRLDLLVQDVPMELKADTFGGDIVRLHEAHGQQAAEYAVRTEQPVGILLGLDLSRTRDMTAAPLLFPWDEDDPEAVRIWPQFWLPEKRAADLDHLYPFRSWSAAGHLTLTAGDVVDYARVEADIVAAVEEHGLIVGGVYFDPWNAEEITQRLADRLGCERIAVRQGYVTLSAVAKEFERRIIAGLIQHPGNSVCDWQVGHVEVRTDANQNIMPHKPATANSGKSIDGVAAALNAMVGIVTGAADAPTITFV